MKPVIERLNFDLEVDGLNPDWAYPNTDDGSRIMIPKCENTPLDSCTLPEEESLSDLLAK